MRGLRIQQSITDRQDYSLTIFFKEVSKIPRMTPEEEKIIAVKAKNGDKRAMDRLITANLRFVISVAKQYQGKGLPLIDLIQFGALGILEACHKYEPERGLKFISFAVWWIRQAIIKALSDYCRMVRVPTNQLQYHSKVSKTYEAFEKEHGRPPTKNELQELTGLEADKIDSSEAATVKSVSLETPFTTEDTGSLLDVIPNDSNLPLDDNLDRKDATAICDEAISKLPDRESDVIRLTFGINTQPLSNEDIGKMFGVGEERIRQLQRIAIKSLRDNHSEEFKELIQ